MNSGITKALFRTVIMAGLAGLTIPAGAQVKVEVSPQFRYAAHGDLKLGMNDFIPFPIGDLRGGDRVSFGVNSAGQNTYVVEFLPTSQLAARQKELGSFTLPWRRKPFYPVPLAPATVAVPRDGNYSAILIADGWWFGSDPVAVNYAIEGLIGPEGQQTLRTHFGQLASVVDQMFQVPSFTIHIGVCGESNARSLQNGDINYCSEMLGDTASYGGAQDGVFFHELGHTLLNLWHLPGADEEDMADQFALYMLLQFQGGPGAAMDLANFFEQTSNPQLEARTIIEIGDTHSIGIQRARNIRGYLRNPEAFVGHWNTLVYPHMTRDQLRRIAASARPYQDAALARALLAAGVVH